MTEIIAVIDTETTWSDDVMSIGVALADSEGFTLRDKRYYTLLPYKDHSAMYSGALYINGIKPDAERPREEVTRLMTRFLDDNGVGRIFAYNASFDKGHLPELEKYEWYDIMRIAAYKQYNRMIPRDADCYGTGRLKRDYGVESIYRMLSGERSYRETHNALYDAVDELSIMRMLRVGIDKYIRMNGASIALK